MGTQPKRSRDDDNTMADSGTEKPERIKIVIRLQDNSIVRAFLNPETVWGTNGPAVDPKTFREGSCVSCVAEDGRRMNFEWTDIKAVFFVYSFLGDPAQRSVRLYRQGPAIENVWVEIVFRDGEILEGCVENSVVQLRDDGFFLSPSSPHSNNRLIYVNKKAIASYRVLGVSVKEDDLTSR